MAFERAKQLEDAFFLEQDKILIQKLKELKQLAENKENLRKASGITNDLILEKLVDLDIQPQSAAALTVVPLIEVAWADGSVSEEERKSVLKAIEKYGIQPTSIEHQLVEQWLTHKPDEILFVAWEHLVQDICMKMSKIECEEFRESVLRDTLQIAQASGGLFGIGSVSYYEQQIINRLKKSFKKQ